MAPSSFPKSGPGSNEVVERIQSYTYHVPRQFGIGALMSVTMLFSFLCAALRSLSISTHWLIYLNTLLAAVMIAQFITPNFPRWSSWSVGVIVGLMTYGITLFLDGGFSSEPFNNPFENCLVASSFGGLTGYVAGLVRRECFSVWRDV